ncbi:hypothetical protein BANRA_01599 [Escherichia coli]|nr:hypothetical protein BANRA_01599 [Escherichia coli]
MMCCSRKICHQRIINLILFSNAFETDVKKYLGKSEDNEVEIKVGNERISIGIRNISNGKLERQKFLFPLDYENKLQHQLDKYFTIESHPLLYRHTMGSKIANVIFEKLYSRIDFNKEQYISFIKDAFLHFMIIAGDMQLVRMSQKTL